MHISTDTFVSGVEKNAQDIADDKNNVKSSNNNEIVHLNKRATMSHQEEKTSDEHNEITGEQKFHISAI
jgi:sorbitol-specific phosphotransferase system component IIBC